MEGGRKGERGKEREREREGERGENGREGEGRGESSSYVSCPTFKSTSRGRSLSWALAQFPPAASTASSEPLCSGQRT